jgi:outer membrane protein
MRIQICTLICSRKQYVYGLACVGLVSSLMISAHAQETLPPTPQAQLLLAQAALPPGQTSAPLPPPSPPGPPAAAGSAAAPPLTRAGAEALALHNNPRITVGHLLSLAQGQVVRQSRSGELPLVNGSLTAEGAYDGSRLGSGSLSDSRLLQHVGGGVFVSQLITDFGRIHNLVSASKLQVQAQQANEQATREDVVLVADQAFFNTLQAQAVLQVAQQTVATRQATQTQIGQLTKNNLRSTLDASFADVNVSQAQLLVLDAQNNADAAMAALDEVLGLDHQQSYTLVDDPGAPPPPPPDVDVLTQMALRQRPDLQALADTRDSEEKLSRAQNEQRLPTISALGTVGGTPVRNGRYFISSWDGAVAANINVPIFNGFLFSSQAKETDLRAEATDAQAAALRDVIVRDVKTAWIAANNNFARIGVTAKLLTQANGSLRLAQTRYDLGLSSIVELSQAQLAQTQADIGFTGAGYSYRAALAALQFQIGQGQ